MSSFSPRSIPVKPPVAATEGWNQGRHRLASALILRGKFLKLRAVSLSAIENPVEWQLTRYTLPE